MKTSPDPLLFGSNEEIAERMSQMDGFQASAGKPPPPAEGDDLKTVTSQTIKGLADANVDFEVRREPGDFRAR